MRSVSIAMALAALVASAASGLAQTAPAPAAPGPRGPVASPPDAKLYVIAPADGARVRSPFVVRFGLKNMGVTQAGSSAPNAGHHHILIDATAPLDPNEPIPANRSHVHFGGGQTETTLDLAPGRHTLQLVLGDADHRPFAPSVQSERITVTVLAPGRAVKRPAKAKPRKKWSY